MSEVRARGWWYPYIFVGALLVVVAVNALMAFFATSTFTGLSTDDAYQKGLEYNRNIAMAERQDALHWTVKTTVESQPVAPNASGARARVIVTYNDKTGQPIDGLEVRALLTRPTVTGFEQRAALPAIAPGVYAETIDLPVNGAWDMDVVALGQSAPYEVAHSFFLP